MIRSILLNVVFFSTISVFLLFGIFVAPLSKRAIFNYWFGYSRFFLWICKYIGGISYELHNPENLIREGNVIYAIRHESLWETLAFISFFKKPVFIMKKELANIPVFGILARRVNSIFIDREQGIKALISVSRQVKDALENNCQVIIFPEGTRMPTGEYVPLKRGIALFYRQSNCKVVPIIHNSGAFWPRHSFWKKPGTIQIKVMEPIPSGLSQDEFVDRLNEIFKTEIEALKITNN